MSNNSIPIAPTIPDSTNFNSNFTRLLKVTDSISAEEFKVPNTILGNYSTLSQGTLSNLNNPLTDSQAATYDYALSQGGSGVPGGFLTSIQFNNSGSFAGTNNFTFNKVTNVLNVPILSIPPMTIQNNTVSGLIDPITPQQAATKNYVDQFTNFTVTDNNTIGATVYTASSLVNGLINRDNQTSGTTTDTLPTAAQMIAAASATVGTAIYFSIRNTNTSYDNVVTFNVGTGMTITASQNIFSGYQYNGVMLVTNIGLGTEAITIYTLTNYITNTTNWQQQLSGFVSKVNVFNIYDYMMLFNEPKQYNPNPFALPYPGIGPDNVANKVVYFTGPGNVRLAEPKFYLQFLSGLGPLMWSSGGSVDFYIINQSTNPGDDITVDGYGSWVIDPNSNMTIPPGHTGQFMVVLYFTDFRDEFSITASNIYCLGIFPTV